jgi:hypothetical protein
VFDRFPLDELFPVSWVRRDKVSEYRLLVKQALCTWLVSRVFTVLHTVQALINGNSSCSIQG